MCGLIKKGELTDKDLLAFIIWNMGTSRKVEVADFWKMMQSSYEQEVNSGDTFYLSVEDYAERWLKETHEHVE